MINANPILFAALASVALNAFADLASPIQPSARPSAAEQAELIAEDQKDLAVQAHTMMPVPAPTGSAIELELRSSHPDGTITIGDEVSFTVTADRDAYLTVINVGTSGRVTVLFPNDYDSDNRLRAGERLSIPSRDARYTIQAGGPAGRELVKAIATTSPTPLFDYNRLTTVGPYRAAGEAQEAAKDLTVTLRNEHEAGWAEANLILNIAPAAPVETFGLSLRTEYNVYPVGSQLQVLATAERDCYLTLLEIGSSGRVRVLLPNRYDRNNFLRAHKTYAVPGDRALLEYRVLPPVGIDTLVGICRTDDAPLYRRGYGFEEETYLTWGDIDEVTKDLALTLRRREATIGHGSTTFWVTER